MDGEGGDLSHGSFKRENIHSSMTKTVDLKLSQTKIGEAKPTYFQTVFFNPQIKQDCKSQACLGLKAADLDLALSTLSEKVDVPFIVGSCVNIPNFGFDVAYFLELLKIPVVDKTLPFDTTVKN